MQRNIQRTVDHNKKLLSDLKDIEDPDFSATFACDRNGKLFNSNKDQKTAAKIILKRGQSNLSWKMSRYKKLTEKEKIIISSVMDLTLQVKNL